MARCVGTIFLPLEAKTLGQESQSIGCMSDIIYDAITAMLGKSLAGSYFQDLWYFSWWKKVVLFLWGFQWRRFEAIETVEHLKLGLPVTLKNEASTRASVNPRTSSNLHASAVFLLFRNMVWTYSLLMASWTRLKDRKMSWPWVGKWVGHVLENELVRTQCSNQQLSQWITMGVWTSEIFFANFLFGGLVGWAEVF